MAKAKNCSNKCNSYDYCVKEGNDKRFLSGATCTDFSPKETVKKPAKKKVAVKKAVAAIVKPKEVPEKCLADDSLIKAIISDAQETKERLDRIVARLSTAKPIKKDM